MFNWLQKLIGNNQPDAEAANQSNDTRSRLDFEQMPANVYAIGDVHGHLDLLLKLEGIIASDCAELRSEALIIMLGDYADRGPETNGLIDHLIDPPSFNARRICLAGNHEEIMLAFLLDPKTNAEWLEFGGRETLLSYGFEEKELKVKFFDPRILTHKINSFIPEEHVDFLRNLPVLVQFPDFVFVHAGIRPGLEMDQQLDKDLMWIRQPFLDYPEKLTPIIVHGHSPVDEPFVSSSRINVDTGAYATGKLTAAKFIDGKFVEFLVVG